MSSAALYLHLIAFLVLSVFHQYSLHRSLLGNPFVVVIQMVSMLNILGMILLCGMFKDTVLPSRLALSSMNKVGSSALGEQRKEVRLVLDSHAYSEQEQAAMSEESSHTTIVVVSSNIEQG